MVEQHQQEKSRLVQTANQLEEAMEQLTKLKDEKENDYLNQIEDLTAQVSLFINRLKLNWSILFSITLSKILYIEIQPSLKYC